MEVAPAYSILIQLINKLFVNNQQLGESNNDEQSRAALPVDVSDDGDTTEINTLIKTLSK